MNLKSYFYQLFSKNKKIILKLKLYNVKKYINKNKLLRVLIINKFKRKKESLNSNKLD